MRPYRPVLVADDDSTIRKMVRLALELDGHRVLEAPDGLMAWQLIGAERPSVVVTDVQMPGIDGLALSGLIRAKRRNAKVVVFTGGMATQTEALMAGADAYVTKGAPLAELRGAVRRLSGPSESARGAGRRALGPPRPRP